MKIGGKCEFWQASSWFTLINQLNRQRGACSRNYRSRCNLHFVIKPFNGNIILPFWWTCILPHRDIRKGVWSRLRTRADGTSWSNITFEIFLWKVNFSFSRNFLEDSTFPVVPFLLVQFIDFKTLRGQFSINSRRSRNSSNKPKMQKIQNRNPIQSPLLLITTFWYAVKYSYKCRIYRSAKILVAPEIILKFL